MEIIARLSPVLSINAPEWFAEDAFLSWLNDREKPLVTWHKRGQIPNEWSDIIVFVDPSLNGEGSENGEMPDRYWDQIISACRESFRPSSDFHVVVRITNLG